MQGHHPVGDLSLVVACIRVFIIYWCGFLFDLLPCTHQDQGTQEGKGWSMVIMGSTGKMTLTASGDEVGFVVFGACTTK